MVRLLGCLHQLSTYVYCLFLMEFPEKLAKPAYGRKEVLDIMVTSKKITVWGVLRTIFLIALMILPQKLSHRSDNFAL